MADAENPPPGDSPIRKKDTTETFAESDVTVTHNKTATEQESIKLGGVDGTTATRTADNSSNSNSGSRGLIINPNTDIEGVKVKLSSNCGTAQDVVLTDTSENILAEKTAGYSAGDVVEINYSLSGSTKYYVSLYDDGNSYTYGFYNAPSFPYSSTDIDITGSVFGAHPDDAESPPTETTSNVYPFIDVTALVKSPSGDALVEWDSAVPADIKSYDLATFQETLDNETVTIDVEDSASNVLFSDIDQNFDISTVDTSKEVKLRVNLSRNDTSNNPTCDYLARRWIQ